MIIQLWGIEKRLVGGEVDGLVVDRLGSLFAQEIGDITYLVVGFAGDIPFFVLWELFFGFFCQFLQKEARVCFRDQIFLFR